MAFENISKGEFIANGRSVRLHNAIMIEARSNRQAEFVAFCFNLQQRYDISKLEEAVGLLEKFNSNFDIPYTEIEQLLKQIKK